MTASSSPRRVRDLRQMPEARQEIRDAALTEAPRIRGALLPAVRDAGKVRTSQACPIYRQDPVTSRAALQSNPVVTALNIPNDPLTDDRAPQGAAMTASGPRHGRRTSRSTRFASSVPESSESLRQPWSITSFPTRATRRCSGTASTGNPSARPATTERPLPMTADSATTRNRS